MLPFTFAKVLELKNNEKVYLMITQTATNSLQTSIINLKTLLTFLLAWFLLQPKKAFVSLVQRKQNNLLPRLRNKRKLRHLQRLTRARILNCPITCDLGARLFKRRENSLKTRCFENYTGSFLWGCGTT